MAKFRINGGFDDAKDVEANHFTEVNSLIIFSSEKTGRDHQVYAMPVSHVRSIERIADNA